MSARDLTGKVPGIAFAADYLSLFAVERGPIPACCGTSATLILALVSDQMPFASRAGISAMTQLGKDPEAAAQVIGALAHPGTTCIMKWDTG